jgi:hypothetical protein
MGTLEGWTISRASFLNASFWSIERGRESGRCSPVLALIASGLLGGASAKLLVAAWIALEEGSRKKRLRDGYSAVFLLPASFSGMRCIRLFIDRDYQPSQDSGRSVLGVHRPEDGSLLLELIVRCISSRHYAFAENTYATVRNRVLLGRSRQCNVTRGC